MKRRKNIKRVLASLLTLQMILFTGFVAYPQQAYAEETVNNQGNEQYLSEDNYEGPKEQNDSGQEEKEIQKAKEWIKKCEKVICTLDVEKSGEFAKPLSGLFEMCK